ncbi:MAG: polysaccharide pyruvyl transferase CsaB [Limnothrix sp.]
MPKVVLCGYYGQGNAGDEALLVTLLQMLPAAAEPIVLSHNTAVTAAAYGVKTVPHKSWQTLQAIASVEWFIWGGGSLMQDVTSLSSPIYYGGLMKFAQLLGKKTLAWAQGIGPLNSQTAQWITRVSLQSCRAVSVRDQGSSTLLDQWRIPHTIAPDPVWALTGIPLDQNLDFPRPRIAVNLRSHPLLTTEKITILSQALQILQKKLNATIILVPFQQSQDQAIAEQLYRELSFTKAIIKINKPQQFQSLFKQVDFMIGMRLHSLIIAASAGCPCFALSYDPKVTQLQQQCDLPGFYLEQLPQDPELIAAEWLTHFSQRQNFEPAPMQRQAEQHRQLLSLIT